MANETFVKLQTITVGAGGAANFTFSSIPQTYTDLKIILSTRGTTTTSATESFQVSLNGSTANFGTNSNISIYDYATATSKITSFTGPEVRFAGYIGSDNMTANVFAATEINVFRYAETAVQKYLVIDSMINNGNATASTSYKAYATTLWADTANITSITLTPSSGTIKQDSTATLYGIGNMSTLAKATGGNVSFTGTYFYHVFNSSDNFTVKGSNISNAEIVYCAGGGGGGGKNTTAPNNAYNCGGGGAGGLLSTTQTLTATTIYAITIGAGGGGGSGAAGARGGNGSNSTFTGLTNATGGGGGAGSITTAGGNGGSGGGGTHTGIAGTGTSGQGNNGGAGASTGRAGSGGGIAGAGTTQTAVGPFAVGGNGAINFSWYGAQGGPTGHASNPVSASGTWGAPQSSLIAGNNAVATTGSGGGGAGATAPLTNARSGGAGGSGFAVIRYLA